MAKGQHVVPNAGGWGVKKAGASRASSVHTTQADAIAAATRIARNQKTELYIHGRDGRIRERNFYGSDPRGGWVCLNSLAGVVKWIAAG